MDTISKYLNLFHLPFFNSSSNSSSTAAAGKVLDTTKSIADTASKSLGSLHVPSLSSGELFGILVIVGVLLLALTLGRTRTLVSTLSIYVAFTLQTIFPFFGWLLKHQSFTNDLPTLRVFVFLTLYAISFALMNRSVLKARFNLGESSFLSVILMGIAQLGLMISILMNLAPSFYNISHRMSSSLLPYFGGQHALFYWALIPIALLLFQKHSE
jgi:hypothetical protein